MINSFFRANIIAEIYEFGVVPADINLLLNLNFYIRFNYSTEQLEIAIKKLKDQGYIKMICIDNYPKEKNKKDAYMLTKKGRNIIPKISDKFHIWCRIRPQNVERLKDRKYDLLNRLAISELFFKCTEDDCFITRDEFFDVYYGEILNQEYKSLRFHGVINMSDRYVPIYNIMFNNLTIDYDKERKFFKEVNEKFGTEFNSFNKIIIANDANIIKKLLTNPLESNSKTIQNTKYKRVFHPSRYEREKSLLVLIHQNELIEYLSDYDYYESMLAKVSEEHAKKDEFVSIKNSFEVYKDNYDSMLFLDLNRLRRIYIKLIETAAGKNQRKYRIYTHISNIPILNIMFLGMENHIKIFQVTTETLEKWCEEKEDDINE